MNSEPVRILRIIARLNVGGPAIHTICLTNRLVERGYETLLVSGREGDREGNMYDLAESQGVQPHFIETLGREVDLRSDLASYREICRLIHQFKPHIVHTHTAKAGALGRLAAHRCKVPLIVHTFHGHVLRGYFGKPKTEFYRRVEKQLGKWSTKLVTVSTAARDELAAMGVAPMDKFVPIPLGLPLEKFRDAKRLHKGKIRNELGLDENHFLVGIVARLAPIKNHREFFQAAKLISAEHSNFRFLVIGDGPLRSELEELVREMKIEDQVIFLGMRADLDVIYGDLNVSVLTSKNEGLPVALIEALASGTPIVGSDVGATHELKNSSWASGIYPPGDVEVLAGAIMEAYRRYSDYQLITREMKSEIIRRYSVERLVDDIDRLYTDMRGLH